MTETLAVTGLDGGYGKLCVFRNVTFTLGLGETIGVTGPNGAGKTTLLKTVAGLLPSLAGTVRLGGRDVDRWPAYRRVRAGIGLVPEGRQILATLSVRDNLELARASWAERRRDGSFERRLEEVFDLFPWLRARLGQPGGSLSGGEQQMLAIARTMLTDPTVMMLDEPTQGLAPVVVRAVLEALNTLKGRCAMIVVEQNRAALERLTDRILLMRAGQLERHT